MLKMVSLPCFALLLSVALYSPRNCMAASKDMILTPSANDILFASTTFLLTWTTNGVMAPISILLRHADQSSVVCFREPCQNNSWEVDFPYRADASSNWLVHHVPNIGAWRFLQLGLAPSKYPYQMVLFLEDFDDAGNVEYDYYLHTPQFFVHAATVITQVRLVDEQLEIVWTNALEMNFLECTLALVELDKSCTQTGNVFSDECPETLLHTLATDVLLGEETFTFKFRDAQTKALMGTTEKVVAVRLTSAFMPGLHAIFRMPAVTIAAGEDADSLSVFRCSASTTAIDVIAVSCFALAVLCLAWILGNGCNESRSYQVDQTGIKRGMTTEQLLGGKASVPGKSKDANIVDGRENTSWQTRVMELVDVRSVSFRSYQALLLGLHLVAMGSLLSLGPRPSTSRLIYLLLVFACFVVNAFVLPAVALVWMDLPSGLFPLQLNGQTTSYWLALLGTVVCYAFGLALFFSTNNFYTTFCPSLLRTCVQILACSGAFHVTLALCLFCPICYKEAGRGGKHDMEQELRTTKLH